ncbi:MAG: amidohydrolase family protein [Kordiimonadaceae bacterium]|nr:amidohydrolase family protein [Kordiimonadaceae bacterium]
MKRYLFLLVGILFFGSSLIVTHAQQTHDLLLTGANIIDVETGNITENGILAIDKNRISFVGDAASANSHQGRQQVNLNGKYIIPGLWDNHVHIEGKDLIEDNKALFPVYIAYGITTVRDMASDLGEQVLAWRDQINRGELFGPEIFTAGRKLEGIGSIWPDDLEIANEAELDQMLVKLDNYHVDLVKITDNALKGELFLKSVQKSHDRGYIVSAHIPYDLVISDVADAGLSSIEHAHYLLRLGSDERPMVEKIKAGEITTSEAQLSYINNFDQDRADAAYRSLAAKNVAVCPTLIGSKKLTYFDPETENSHPFRQYLTDLFVAKYQWRIDRMANDTPTDKARKIKSYELVASQLPHVQKAGMLILAGSDSAPVNTYVYPALAIHEELGYFQDAGLTTLEALQAATINNAKFMGKLDRLSTLKPGKEADIVVLNSNPLDNIRATQDIYAVINNGAYFDRAALDEFLRVAQQKRNELNQSRKE